MNRFYKKTKFEIDFVAPNKSHILKFIKSFAFLNQLDGVFLRQVLNLKVIFVFPGNDYYGEVLSREKVWMCQTKTVRDASLVYLASLMVHEAWHIIQWKRGVKNIASRAERGAYLMQRKFLIAAHDTYSARWLDKAYKEKWWIDADVNHITRPSKNQYVMRREMLNFFKDYKTGKLKIVSF